MGERFRAGPILPRVARPIRRRSMKLAAKFLDCARFAQWPAAKADALVASVRKLEEIPDVRPITALVGA